MNNQKWKGIKLTFFTDDDTFKNTFKGSDKFNMNNEESRIKFQGNTLFGMMLMRAS